MKKGVKGMRCPFLLFSWVWLAGEILVIKIKLWEPRVMDGSAGCRPHFDNRHAESVGSTT